MSYSGNTISVVKSLVAAARSEQITFLAASLAYYTFVSLMPLLLLGIVVATALGGEGVATAVVERAGGVLSPGGEDVLETALTSGEGRGGATIVGVAVLVWGALKVFRGLDVAFAQVYGTGGPDSLLTQVKDAAVALAAVGGGIGIAVLVGALIARSGVAFAGLLGTPAMIVALVIAFLPLYVVLPQPNVTPREGLPGAVLAATGWTVLASGFRIYAANAGSFQLYGVIGGVLLLVTWFYFGGIVLLLGGVLNAVLADRAAPDDVNRQLQQEPLRETGQRASMTDEHGGTTASDDETPGDGDARDEELDALRDRIDEFESEIDDRTVHREEIESDLKRYVRRRVRRGHARGWGPYLVLLYGTVMTLGAFYFLGGGWAILAMLVIWLSVLGLYTLMVLVGVTVSAVGLPGRLRDWVQEFRG
ncbi:YihY/virulence factor BrkB family protein [Halorientalis marina]|uniref:YihY/virulence factor BrkB family protein n=1 Tax=Halorientalis marina TaxID=2931976 RepID=UPI001FF38637|nr:YihY/virulence factor BrkB family protein [Halorientalis marina]